MQWESLMWVGKFVTDLKIKGSESNFFTMRIVPKRLRKTKTVFFSFTRWSEVITNKPQYILDLDLQLWWTGRCKSMMNPCTFKDYNWYLQEIRWDLCFKHWCLFNLARWPQKITITHNASIVFYVLKGLIHPTVLTALID